MAPSSRPLDKKQKSLTSFFTPKTVSGLAATFEKQSRAAASASASTSASTSVSSVERKRRRNDVTQDPDAVDSGPNAKKQRSSPLDADCEEASSPIPNDSDKNGDNAPAATPPGRAGRYTYDASVSTQDDVDETTRRSHEELHHRFVKKLGHPDALSWRARGQLEDAPAGGDDQDAEAGAEDDDDEPVAPTKASNKRKTAKSGKLTPMELQFLDIKRKHLDTVLIVEVGYKFRFFGEDARIAAKELSIVCIPGKLRYDEHPSEAHLDRFASASIPVHRLSVHAKRLVSAGHKVGVVRQIETAALKKAGDNRNTPFIRKLTSLYTKGTYIDENGELDEPQQANGASSSSSSSSSSGQGGYLLAVTETKAKGGGGIGTDEKVDVGILAVQPATGDIIYDNFEDGFMRSEIETRLLHISPCEFLLVGDLTPATEKLVRHLSASSTNVFGDRSRVERVPPSSTMAAEASAHVGRFYASASSSSTSSSSTTTTTTTNAQLLDKVLRLPEPVTICLSSMINHLAEFGLDHIFHLTKYFQSFTTRAHMLVGGTTLESLEVYRNSTDHSCRGSLFWALDKTLTRPGQRLLRKWVGRPLLDRARLEERMAAVQELLEKQSTSPVDELEQLLASIRTDLERSLIRIYYAKCTRPELLAVLQTLQKIAIYYHASARQASFATPLLAEATAALPKILGPVNAYLERVNASAARNDDKYAFFRDAFQTDEMQEHQMAIAHVEHELEAHRRVAAVEINRTKIDYVTVAGIEFLIEVPNTDVRLVPASWAKISGTKKLSRFHTPTVLTLVAERDQHREALAAACDCAFAALLAEIAAAHYQPLRDAVAAVATLDCLLSLAKVAAQPGYTRPTVLPADAEPSILVSRGRHPMAELTLVDTAYIPFTADLAHPCPLAYLVTGPNMGGKSSFVRALALIVLLAQIGSFVPADALSLTLCDAIHTRAGAHDNLFAGESTFMVEVSETSRILRSATPRSLVILDELGRGTSTHDGAAIAHAVLQHVVTDIRCLTLFITHYQNLARVADGLDGVKNVHMKFRAEDSSDGGDQDITFLYELGDGVAHRSYGLNVARLARIPKTVLDVAAQKSAELELDVRSRRLTAACRTLAAVIAQPASHQLPQLIDSIAQL